jgi:hypothetical protein
MRVVVIVIKRMEEESCELLQIPTDQITSIRLITTMKVHIWFISMLKGIEVRIPLVIFFSIFKLICNGQRPRASKCC